MEAVQDAGAVTLNDSPATPDVPTAPAGGNPWPPGTAEHEGFAAALQEIARHAPQPQRYSLNTGILP